MLLATGADPNVEVKPGVPLLARVAERMMTEMGDVLVQFGADVGRALNATEYADDEVSEMYEQWLEMWEEFGNTDD